MNIRTCYLFQSGFRITLIFTFLSGIHLIQCSKDKCNNVVCPKRLCLLGLYLTFYSVAFCGILISILIEEYPYWFLIFIMPHFFTLVLAIIIYINIIVNRSSILRLFDNIDIFNIPFEWRSEILTLLGLLFTVFTAFSLIVTMPFEMRLMTLPLMIVTIVPSSSDQYMMMFVHLLSDRYKNLTQYIKKKCSSWYPSDVLWVSNEWLSMNCLLYRHNKVINLYYDFE